jgi:methionyl-tRNA formyltransferase
MRALFWGTSDFALPTLQALADSPHELVGVVTQPDRPAGRGRSVRQTPVRRRAGELDVRVLQPEKPRGETFLSELRALAPDVSVVAAYGEILTREVLDLPSRGSINVHASLLPELRGAAPINWAVIRGHERGGVTIMEMVRELDAGPILRQAEVVLPPRITAGELFEELAELGAEELLATLEALEEDRLERREQDDDRATYAPKLDRETARLDWTLSAEELDRWIRGCDPWPAAWSELETDDGRLAVQLFSPDPGPAPADEEPGRVVLADPKRGLRVRTGRGVLGVGEVKPAGKRRMEAAAWIRGRGIAAGQRFV